MRTLGIMLALGALALAAWYGLNKPLQWTEEVQLASGEVIVVQRTVHAQSLGEIGGPGGWESEGMTLEIISPQLPDKPPVWDFPYVPIVFDRDPQTQEWFVVATFYTCERWHELGKPKLPYAQWRARDGIWQRTELNPELIGRKANVLTAIRSSGEPDHTLKSKEDIMSDGRIASKYKRIYDGWKPLGCSKGAPLPPNSKQQ